MRSTRREGVDVLEQSEHEQVSAVLDARRRRGPGERRLVLGRGKHAGAWVDTPLVFGGAPIDDVTGVDLAVDAYGVLLVVGAHDPADGDGTDVVGWSLNASF